MKIDAEVELLKKVADSLGLSQTSIVVPVDIDYVSAYEDEIYEWVANELGEMFNRSFGDDEFHIMNLEEIQDEIGYDS